MNQETDRTGMKIKALLIWACSFATLFIIMGISLIFSESPKEDKGSYPGQIGYIEDVNNADLAPVEIITSFKEGIYSSRTIYGEPIVFGPRQILTTTDSGKTWHEYSFFDSTELRDEVIPRL
ncbi:hypothetical protein ISR92_03330 [Patescibacteria group bacterium]|nr:hypothetical protein [Patescibacteria group bacterium]